MKQRHPRRPRGKPRHDPSPEEIRDRCEVIRSTWSDKVYQKRASLESVPLTIPVAPPYFEYLYVRELV